MTIKAPPAAPTIISNLLSWTPPPSDIGNHTWERSGKLLVLGRSRSTGQDWLTDWLNDWMTDWMTDWLTDTLTHYTHSLPAHSVNHSLTDWLPIKMTDWLTDSLTDWLTERLTRWQTDWLIHPLTKSFIDWLPKWLTDWRTDWLPDRLSDRSKQLATSHLSGSLKAWCLFRHLVEWTDHACLLVEPDGKPKTDNTVTCGFSKMQHAPGYRKLRKGWYPLKSDAKYASNKKQNVRH